MTDAHENEFVTLCAAARNAGWNVKPGPSPAGEWDSIEVVVTCGDMAAAWLGLWVRGEFILSSPVYLSADAGRHWRPDDIDPAERAKSFSAITAPAP